jgi:hypothetical protein
MATPRSARTSKVPEEIELDLGLDEPDDEASLKARAALVGDGPAGTLLRVRAGAQGRALGGARPWQARAAAAPRSQGPLEPQGHGGPRQQLLLRRGRRGHLQRRQALHAQPQARRHRDVLETLTAARRARHPDRRAPAHRHQQAAPHHHRHARGHRPPPAARCASSNRVTDFLIGGGRDARRAPARG